MFLFFLGGVGGVKIVINLQIYLICMNRVYHCFYIIDNIYAE